MKLELTPEGIEFDKVENELDKLTFKFCSILNKHKIEYVIVSGYVAILFGRNRMSEDIDIIIKKITEEQFHQVWNDLIEELLCINAEDCTEGYREYLSNSTSLRFSQKERPLPNVEIKFADDDLDEWTLKHKIKVIVNDNVIFISPIELQIAFKLHLGSEKDKEDAYYLFELFKKRINKEQLLEWGRKLNIEKELQWLQYETP